MITENDPNIMETCFKNGERHMKEKVVKLLLEHGENKDGVCKALVLDLIKNVEAI